MSVVLGAFASPVLRWVLLALALLGAGALAMNWVNDAREAKRENQRLEQELERVETERQAETDARDAAEAVTRQKTQELERLRAVKEGLADAEDGPVAPVLDRAIDSLRF